MYTEAERGRFHGSIVHSHSLRGRLFIDCWPERGQWLLCRHTDDLDPRACEIVSSHPTEQAAEHALRRLLFPKPPEDWRSDD